MFESETVGLCLVRKLRWEWDNNCNLKCELTKTIPVIFCNLRTDDSHVIMQQIGRFNFANIDVIANGLEKYMAIIVNYNLVFIVFTDTIKCMNFSQEDLIKNLGDDGFKYLSQKYNVEQLKLVK